MNHNCLSCANLNVVNLSGIPLSQTQIILLNKGLTFIPTARNAKSMEILKDFNAFATKTKKQLNRCFNLPRQRRPDDEPELHRKPHHKQNNTNTDNLGPKVLEDAFKAMRNEILKLELNATTKYNLTRKERSTLKELATNKI